MPRPILTFWPAHMPWAAPWLRTTADISSGCTIRVSPIAAWCPPSKTPTILLVWPAVSTAHSPAGHSGVAHPRQPGAVRVVLPDGALHLLTKTLLHAPRERFEFRPLQTWIFLLALPVHLFPNLAARSHFPDQGEDRFGVLRLPARASPLHLGADDDSSAREPLTSSRRNASRAGVPAPAPIAVSD